MVGGHKVGNDLFDISDVKARFRKSVIKSLDLIVLGRKPDADGRQNYKEDILKNVVN